MPVKPGGRTDPASRLRKVVSAQEPIFASAFLLAVQVLRDNKTLEQLAFLLEQGQLELALEWLAAAADNLGGAYGTALTNAGNEAAAFLSTALTVNVSYDIVNFRAVDAINRNRFRLINGFSADQRNTVREIIQDASAKGLNPKAQARLFRQSIGLTATQAKAVENYRTLLEQSSSDALNRALRDRRFDRTLERVIREGGTLTNKQINRMVERYRERYLIYRSQVIARSEALSATHEGTDIMYQQAIDLGEINADTLEKTWITAKDESVRDSHALLKGTVRGVGETFPADDGPLRFPGDPQGPASETIQCRCVLSTRINE